MEQKNSLCTLTPLPAPDYPGYCAIFLKAVEPAHLMLPAMTKLLCLTTGCAPDDANRIVAETKLLQMAHLAATTQYPVKALGWDYLSAVMPAGILKDYCRDKKGAQYVAHADRTTEFLAPKIGQQNLAGLLPTELRTEQAAAYMHKRGHYALQAVIDRALTL